jgi:hypothetical protein
MGDLPEKIKKINIFAALHEFNLLPPERNVMKRSRLFISGNLPLLPKAFYIRTIFRLFSLCQFKQPSKIGRG